MHLKSKYVIKKKKKENDLKEFVSLDLRSIFLSCTESLLWILLQQLEQ